MTDLDVYSAGNGCRARPDGSMAWRAFMSWYLHVLHLGACGLLVGGMIHWVDEKDFQTGSPPSFSRVDPWLYQTQVTGLLSMALIAIRLLSGACTGLLMWRAIYVLLEKQGVTLVELTRLSNWRIPPFFRAGSPRAALWSLRTGHALPDGSLGDEKTPCPSRLPAFGTVSAVEPYSISYTWSDANHAWAGRDCFLMAEATITAGEFAGRDCLANTTGTDNYYATCIAADLTTGTARPSWFSSPALDFLSETLKYTVSLNFTGAWLGRRQQQSRQGPEFPEFDLDAYATAALRLGYDAAWSQMVMGLVSPSEPEPVSLRQGQAVVRAVLNRMRLYIWLGLNGLVAVSALLVAWAQSRTTVAVFVRDTTLAPLLMDMSVLTHNAEVAAGLCSAGSLRKEDKQLPPMVWKNSRVPSLVDTLHVGGGVDGGCRRRVVFAADLKG